jgi:large subunit ribosomal protein L35e
MNIFPNPSIHLLTSLQSSTAKVKPSQLWGKSRDDLKKQLDELKTELGQLRVQKIAGGASSKLTRMYAP